MQRQAARPGRPPIERDIVTNMTAMRMATGLATLVALGGVALPAAAQDLPNPYVSRALDAVLLPVDDGVISAFGLHPDDFGSLVLATQPGGSADKAGILPGDVISIVRGKPVYDPVELDSVVWYWIMQGVADFGWELYRGEEYYYVDWLVTEEEFWTEIDISEAASWTSWSYESWSYSEYYESYSEVMIEEYSYSESWIEETVTSEEFVSETVESYEEYSEETVTEETMTEETMTEEEVSEETMSEEEVVEEDMSEEDVTEEEVAEEDVSEEEAVEEDVAAEEEAVEEEAAEEEAAEEDMAAEEEMAEEEAVEEEAVEEESFDEEPVEEESFDEEPVEEDFGGDDGGGEEVIEE